MSIDPDIFHMTEAAQGRRVVAVTGHRPDKLGGYARGIDGWVPAKRRAVQQKLRDALEAQVDMEIGDIVAVTGMAQGVDQDWAEAAIALGVPFVAAVPFEDQDRLWPEAARVEYRRILIRARDVIVVSPGPYTIAKMHARNAWMVRACDTLVAVWDGTKGGTAHAVGVAQTLRKPIIRIMP